MRPHRCLVRWLARQASRASLLVEARGRGPKNGDLRDRPDPLTERQRNFFLNFINARRSEIRPVRIFAEPVPYWLDLNDLANSRMETTPIDQTPKRSAKVRLERRSRAPSRLPLVRQLLCNG